MVFLSDKDNRNAGTKQYSEKQEILRHSTFKTANLVSETYQEWNSQKIAAFQKRLAKNATQIWRVDF